MELKKYRLGEVCTIIPGYAFKSSDFGCGKNWVIKILPHLQLTLQLQIKLP